MSSQHAHLVRSRVPLAEVVNNRWIVGNIIGYGAHDNVYSVRDSTNRSTRVVIRFHNRFVSVETTLSREDSFLEALNNLRSRGRSTAHEFGIHGDIPYVVMPNDYKISYGEDVMPTRTVLAITRKVLRVIQRLHDKGAVHGDIREANVLLGLSSTTPNAYLINLESSEEFTRESQRADIWYLMDMMVRMLRNGEKGVLPEGEMCISHSDQGGYVQEREILRNVQAACTYRRSIGSPVPGEVSDLIAELLSSSCSYERMERLLKRAEARCRR